MVSELLSQALQRLLKVRDRKLHYHFGIRNGLLGTAEDAIETPSSHDWLDKRHRVMAGV